MLSRRLHYAIWVVAAVLVGTGAVVAWWWRSGALDLERWRQGPPPYPWAALARQEQVWAEEGLRRHAQHFYRPLEGISYNLQVAVIVGEDISFFSHRGIDPAALWEAIGQWREGRRLRGASTITQQLARTLFLSSERSVLRKLREARLAFWMDRRLGKRRILELYLNVVEFGPGVFGVEAAAQHFYQVPASALDDETAAGLAAAIPSPARDNPASRTQRWENRRKIILRRMNRATWLREIIVSLCQEPLVKAEGSL